MATQTIKFDAVSLVDVGSGVITATLLDGNNTAITSIVETSVRGRYTGTVEDIAAGEYEFIVFYNNKRVASAWVDLELTTDEFQAVNRWELPSNSSNVDLSSLVDAHQTTQSAIANLSLGGTGGSGLKMGVTYRHTAIDDGEFHDVMLSAPYDEPEITLQPVNQTITENEGFSLSVAAVNNILDYQWQVNSGSGWVNIEAEVRNSYSTTGVSFSQNGYLYRCVVNGRGGSVTSDVVTLSVVEFFKVPMGQGVTPIELILEGNSMTVPLTANLQTVLDNAYPATFNITNVATSGQTTAEMLTSFATDITANAIDGETFATIWTLVNDFQLTEITARDAVNEVWAWCDNAVALGVRPILITPTPRSNDTINATYEARRQEALGYLRDEWEDHCSGVLDLAADPRIGDDGDALDTTYYVDKIHMTSTGREIVNRGIKLVLDGLIEGGFDGSPEFETNLNATAIVIEDQTLAMSAIAIGEGAGGVDYQWQSSVNGIVWTDIVGETTHSYTSPALTENVYYRVVATNRFGSTNSIETEVTIFSNPSDVASVATYYEAGTGVYQEHDSELTVSAETDKVGTWSPIVGTQKLRALSTGATRPSLEDAFEFGRPVVRFDGDNDVLFGDNPINAKTIFIVFKYDNATFLKDNVGIVTGVSNTDLGLSLQGDQTGDTNLKDSSVAGSDVFIRHNGTEYDMAGDDTVVVPAPMNVFATYIVKSDNARNFNWQLGRDRGVTNGTRQAKIEVAELAFFSENLSDVDCQTLEAYANLKYSIS